MDSGKSSRLRLLRSTRLPFFCLVALCGAAWAQPAADGNSASGEGTLDAFLRDVNTLTADFKQELWSADQRLLQTDTGTLSLRRRARRDRGTEA